LRWNSNINAQHSISVQTNAQQWERLREWRACDAQISFSSELNELWRISTHAQRKEFNSRKPSLNNLNLTARQLELLRFLPKPAQKTLPHSCGLINENSRESRFDVEVQDTY